MKNFTITTIFIIVFMVMSFSHSEGQDEILINSTTEGNQGLLDLDMDHDGNIVVAWISWSSVTPEGGIFAQRFNPDGTKIGSEIPVFTEPEHYNNTPSVSMDADGDFVVAIAKVYVPLSLTGKPTLGSSLSINNL